ncbi:UDP-glycosyltransferase 84B1-like [Chenopodium quinoa]|uniref:UDP-glycosyltransferase 84B1-like n=1 Tax=Chenopodium quinoa TaxID=63459 RepID=UPI000B788A91|nr:UDP-glycosyltransferase 84B1-like [Chenopodium quinoa]
MEEENKKIHVLMVAFSSQGHINPMLRLGKHLQNKGLHVTLAVTEIFLHRIAKINHLTTATTTTNTDNQIPSISGIDIVSFSDGLSLEYDRKSNLDTYMKTLAEFGPVNLTSLITSLGCDITSPKKFSCVINNPFVPWVADVAVRLGIPCGMLWIQPCTLFAIYHGFYKSPEDFPTKENPEKSVNLPGLPLLQTSDLPSFVLPFNVFGSLANVFFESMENIHKLRWVMANSFYELEKEVIDSMSKFVVIKGVGPLVPSTLLGQDDHEERDFVGIDMWKADDRCIEWLNQKDPNSVVYVSFGSLVVLSKTQMESMATAIRESKRPFLWVVKPSQIQTTEGAGELPKGFLDETKGQGLVVPWCPQIMVLSHKSIACFVTHCGWNSMLETISAGVPVIAYPMWTDQPTNAKLMADIFGVGLRLRPYNDGLVESETIKECIEEIMDGPRAAEIRAKAVEWKSMARDAVASGGSLDRNIQEFVDDIVKLSSSH